MRGFYAAVVSKSDTYRGAMMSVALSRLEAQQYLERIGRTLGRSVVVACINSPCNVTISGEERSIDALKMLLDDESIFARKLLVDVAYHSPQMEPIAAAFGASIDGLKEGFESTTLTMISSLTGKRIANDQLLLVDYWVRNMVSPVNFSEAFEHLCTEPGKIWKKLDRSHLNNPNIDIFLEIGPHSALQAPIRDILRHFNRISSVHYLSALRRHTSALDSILDVAGQLHCYKYPVDLLAVNNGLRMKTDHLQTLSDLPEYPFDHSKSYWHESRVSKALRLRKQPKLDLLGKPAADWNPLEARWRHFIKISELPWIEDHRVSSS